MPSTPDKSNRYIISLPLLNRGGIFLIYFCCSVGAKFLNTTLPRFACRFPSKTTYRLMAEIRIDGHHHHHHHHDHDHHPVYLLLAQDEPLPPRAININNCTAEIRAYIMYYTYREGAGSRGPVIRLPVMAVPRPHGELHSNYSRLRAALLLSAGRYVRAAGGLRATLFPHASVVCIRHRRN